MEDPSTTFIVISLIISGILCFLASLSQTALMRLPTERINEWKAQEKHVAHLLETLTVDRKKLLGLFDFFNLLSTATYFSLLTYALFFYRQLEPETSFFYSSGGFILGFVIFAFFLQALPRQLGHRHVEKLSKSLSPFVFPLFRFLNWIAPLFEKSSSMIAAAFGQEPEYSKPVLTDEEIKWLIQLGKDKEFEIEKEDKEMIQSVVTFGKTMVKEIMTPRIDMVSVNAETPLSGVLDVAITHGYSKFPVYEGTPDNIIGIIYIKDLFRLVRSGEPHATLKDLVRKPFFVPESKKVDDLLRDMQKEKISMAIVVDEYGGTDGLVTIEDLLEEIVGEIDDEHDTQLPDILRLDDNSWLVDGQINLEDLNSQLGLNLPTQEFETLGGYVYGLMGKVPKAGDKIETDSEILEVSVVHRQRISKVKLIKKPIEPAPHPHAE